MPQSITTINDHTEQSIQLIFPFVFVMRSSSSVVVVVVALVVCVACVGPAWGKVSGEEMFNIKPNGQTAGVSVVASGHEGGGATQECVFSYAAMGGTNEDWMAVAEVDPSTGGVECTFARPDAASYLFFNSFSAGIVAGENNVPLTQIQVYDNSGLLLEGEAYVLDTETNTIVPGPSFEGLISRISITNH